MADPRVCSICQSDKGQVINAFLQAGRSSAWIEREMRAMGYPVKAETIRKHLLRDLGGDPARAAILDKASQGDIATDNRDFAMAIRAEANRALANGTLRVTAAHGLTAQALIDRRVEKQADRALMVQLASLLTGASIQPPEDLIEGEWREVEGDRPALGTS